MSEAVVRKWRRPKFWVPAALIVFFVVAGVAMRFASTSAANQRLEAIRKEGLPANSLELDTWYKRVPLSDNAAEAILLATFHRVAPAAGKNPNGNSMDEFVTRGPVPPKLAEAIAEYVRANAAAIEKLEEAVRLSGSRYPVDLTKGAAITIGHLSPVKDLAFLMKWAAVQGSLEGKPDVAVRHLKTGFAIAGTLALEPLLISELVRIACVAIILPAVERVVNDHQLSFEQASELEEVLRKVEEQGPEAMLHGMVGEHAIGVDNFNLTYQQFDQLSGWGATTGGGPVGFFKALFFNFRRVSGINERDKAFFIDTMTRWVRATKMGFPEMLRECERVDDLLEAELGKHPTRYLVSKMLLPQLSGVAKKEALLAARLRCARMALAIEKFRARNSGKLPSLADLQPDYLQEVPRDPVDDRPLEYRLGGAKGYTVLAATSTALANEGRRKTNAFAAGFVVER